MAHFPELSIVVGLDSRKGVKTAKNGQPPSKHVIFGRNGPDEHLKFIENGNVPESMLDFLVGALFPLSSCELPKVSMAAGMRG